MLMRTLLTGLFAGLMLLSTAGTAVSAQERDPATAFADLRDLYDMTSALSASFTQQVQNPFGETQRAAGRLFVEGNAFRIEMDDQTIVADGETTWIHDLANGQVLVSPYEDDAATFAPSTLLLRLDDSFEAVDAGTDERDGTRLHTLTITSDAPEAMFTSLRLWYEPDSLHILRVRAEDVNDTVLTFDLSNVTLNPDLNASLFTFEIPDDVDVIDLRS
jgi:outer membrane lipoprotein carrier protein